MFDPSVETKPITPEVAALIRAFATERENGADVETAFRRTRDMAAAICAVRDGRAS